MKTKIQQEKEKFEQKEKKSQADIGSLTYKTVKLIKEGKQKKLDLRKELPRISILLN